MFKQVLILFDKYLWYYFFVVFLVYKLVVKLVIHLFGGGINKTLRIIKNNLYQFRWWLVVKKILLKKYLYYKFKTPIDFYINDELYLKSLLELWLIPFFNFILKEVILKPTVWTLAITFASIAATYKTLKFMKVIPRILASYSRFFNFDNVIFVDISKIDRYKEDKERDKKMDIQKIIKIIQILKIRINLLTITHIYIKNNMVNIKY